VSVTNPKPWHRRVPVVGKTRDGLRACFFWSLRSAFGTDDGRKIASDALRGILAWRPTLPDGSMTAPPYADLGHLASARASLRARPVIITARFRSGSTLLWNIFRHVEGCTAYYEPFNERRWFDPGRRGKRIDGSHLGIDNYWREYQGLESVGAFYREEWIDRNLYMDASFWDPDMQQYVARLIEAAPGRAVLQFNRIDFRLAWFRRKFPAAHFVHLYRHPRDQWCSSLIDPKCVPRDIRMEAFEPHDHFYLRRWARDLKYHFPFLDEVVEPHPYRLFYYIWRLSYLFGRAYADLSLSFEELIESPNEQIRLLMATTDVEKYDLDALRSLVASGPIGRWHEYADDAWFRSHESACEDVLRDFVS
jgi:hypothetical protein